MNTPNLVLQRFALPVSKHWRSLVSARISHNSLNELLSVWLPNCLSKVHDVSTHLCQESDWVLHSVLDRQMICMLLVSNWLSQFSIIDCLICNQLPLLKSPSSSTSYGFILHCGFLIAVRRILNALFLLEVIASLDGKMWFSLGIIRILNAGRICFCVFMKIPWGWCVALS